MVKDIKIFDEKFFKELSKMKIDGGFKSFQELIRGMKIEYKRQLKLLRKK